MKRTALPGYLAADDFSIPAIVSPQLKMRTFLNKMGPFYMKCVISLGLPSVKLNLC